MESRLSRILARVREAVDFLCYWIFNLCAIATLIRVLIAEGILLAALSLLTLMIPTLFSSFLSFPLEQIALGMRALSLTGIAGNGISMLLIALFALIPLFFALRYPGGRDTLAERIALFVLALMLPVALYGILNPGKRV